MSIEVVVDNKKEPEQEQESFQPFGADEEKLEKAMKYAYEQMSLLKKATENFVLMTGAMLQDYAQQKKELVDLGPLLGGQLKQLNLTAIIMLEATATEMMRLRDQEKCRERLSVYNNLGTKLKEV
jgi:hypothetical protein